MITKSALFEFRSGHDLCRGKHFAPESDSRHVVLITAAIGQIQEQAPYQYAIRLAARGVHALTFDHRSFGLSDGSPRQWEHPGRKVEDIESLARWVKAGGLGIESPVVSVLGICKGGAYSLQAASQCDAIDHFIGVSGFYFDEVSLEVESGYQRERLAQGLKALERYESQGIVDYLPITGEPDSDAALPYSALHAWYSPWEVTSRWQNRYAVMSDYPLYQLESAPHAQSLDKPALIIHANKSTNPGSAKRVFEQIPHEDKKLAFYEDGVDFQTNFYEREPLIERACEDVLGWLDMRDAATLMPGPGASSHG